MGLLLGLDLVLHLHVISDLVSEKANFLNAFIHVGLIPDSGNLYYLTQSSWTCKSNGTSYVRRKSFSCRGSGNWVLRHRLISVDTWERSVSAFAARLASFANKSNWFNQTFFESSQSSFF